jgi:hypothetical protein
MPETTGWVIDKKTLDDVFKQLEDSRKAIDAAEKIIREHTISRDIKTVDLPVRTLTLPDLKTSIAKPTTGAELLELIGHPKGSVSTLTPLSTLALPGAKLKTTGESADYARILKWAAIGWDVGKIFMHIKGKRFIEIGDDVMDLLTKTAEQ